MEKISHFEELLNADISDLEKGKQKKFYQKLLLEIDDEMDKESDLDLFEELLNIKKSVMAKIRNMEER